MNTTNDNTPQSLYDWTQIIYGLHALSLLTGILGAATVIGAFLIGWPSIIAVIMNYIKRSEASGTWLESHFRWQIRTFWYGAVRLAAAGPALHLVHLPHRPRLDGPQRPSPDVRLTLVRDRSVRSVLRWSVQEVQRQ